MDGTNKYFPQIETYHLSRRLLEETLAALATEGQFRVESMVFWAGTLEGISATLTHILVPKGRGVFQHPLQFRLDEHVVAALCDHLDPPRITLLGQIHTHLEEAFHSWADDSFTFDTPGYLSLVVPYFGQGGIGAWDQWAIHESAGRQQFRALQRDEIERRFAIDNNPQASVTVCEVRA